LRSPRGRRGLERNRRNLRTQGRFSLTTSDGYYTSSWRVNDANKSIKGTLVSYARTEDDCDAVFRDEKDE